MGIDDTTRVRLWRTLQHFNETYGIQPDSNDNWIVDTSHLEELPSRLLDVYGEETLSADLDELCKETGLRLKDWIRKTSGERVLDAVEAFLIVLGDEERIRCVAMLNEVLEQQDSPWRLLTEQFVLLDSVFVHTELVQRASEALSHADFEGSARHLIDAHHDLADGDTRGTIHNAGCSLENTMKAMLRREDGTTKRLLDDLLATGAFDDVPERHRAAFVNNVIMSLPWLRNRFGGHGRGPVVSDLPNSYGRLALGLAAVLNEFLVRLHLERSATPTDADIAVGDTAHPKTDDFVPLAASMPPSSNDYDIPF